MEEKLVTVASFTDNIQAELAKQLLCDNGIEAVVVGDNASSVYPLPIIEGPELQVFEGDAEKAKQILESAMKQEE